MFRRLTLDGLEIRKVLVCLYLKDKAHRVTDLIINQQIGKDVYHLKTVNLTERVIPIVTEADKIEEIEFDFPPEADENVVSLDLDDPNDFPGEYTGTTNDERNGTNERGDDMEVSDKDIG
jgi:hypothetical protein